MNREPEKAALEAFAKILSRKRGGAWLPVEGDQLDVAKPRAGEVSRAFVSPTDENPVLDRPSATTRGTA
jgi:hypothetical protein